MTSSHTWANRSRGNAADLFDHLRGVAGEVPLQHLEHAPRMLQRVVGVRRRVGGGAAGAVGFAASCPPQSPPDALLRIGILMLTAGGLYFSLPW